VKVYANKKQPGAIGMYYSQESALVHISHNMGNTSKGQLNVITVMHGKEQSSEDLD